MFDNDRKKNQLAKTNESTTTLIGQGIFIEGQTFKGVGTVRIDGVYVGEMSIDGHVIIGQTGEIRGNITSNTMVLAGTVTGNILCREELHIADTAVMDGDIQTHLLLVDQGAVINGTVGTGRKPLAEPIMLDEAVKNVSDTPRKSIDVLENKSRFPSTFKKQPGDSNDVFGFFSKDS